MGRAMPPASSFAIDGRSSSIVRAWRVAASAKSGERLLYPMYRNERSKKTSLRQQRPNAGSAAERFHCSVVSRISSIAPCSIAR